ncbi:MAG: tetratricopeptide repeat protein, partial [Candidatus Eremiobacteraeota bacterium]|nr:tetratricopeptide repeat protein [Candidatus Eremiobacteraeota bacterium]
MSSPSGRPSGIVTFLFTDIEGSTRLWENDAAAMSVALAAHDEIVRSAIEARGGFVFKTVGDAFCAAFNRPWDALTAALDAQRTLAEHPWGESIKMLRVRMGIHTGTAVEAEGDYFGPTVNRVARLMSIGYGEQILVSGATAPLLRDELPDGTTLRSLGTHRLKDLTEPEPTFQVLAPGLRADFPVLRSIDSRPNNLPFQISSFIGRERELGDLRGALAQRRLISIVGPGGIGKTRLALQAAAEAIDHFPDGAWIVPFSPLRDGDLIAHAVADALQIRESPQEPLDVTIACELAGREMLLVLDSAEHLLAPAAAFVKAILSRCATLKMLVTSREPLHLTGEFVLRVGPLETAAELLLDRAREVLGDFLADEAARRAVEEICGRLECIPLAIELAAARTATMPLAELSARLGRGLSVLVSRDPTKEERHRTLRATIAWSYGLLNPDEAELLRALGVFRGSFEIEAAASVAQRSEDETLDTIEALADKSLVSLTGGAMAARYILPDAVRDFARDSLRADGLLDVLAGRHFDHYAGFVSARTQRSVGTDLAARFDELAAEMSNVRTALEWGLAHRPAEAAVMGIGLSSFWKIRGPFAEGRSWLRRLLDVEAITGVSRAALLRRAATLATEQDDYDEARALTLECRGLYEDAGDAGGVAEALFNLGVIEQRRGRLDEAEAHYGSAIPRFREAGHDHGESLAHVNVALLAFDHDDVERAERHIEAASAAAARSGNADARGYVAGVRGDLARRCERWDDAIAHYLEARALKQAVGNRYGVAEAQSFLALIYVRQGRIAEARAAVREALRAALQLDATSLAIFGFEAA